MLPRVVQSLLLIAVVAACSAKTEPPAASRPVPASSGSRDAATVALPIPSNPSIASGPLPITLAKIDVALTVRVPAASTFVVIAKSGELSVGALAPGPTPYAGTTSSLVGLAAAVDAADGRAPTEARPVTIEVARGSGEPPVLMSRRARGTLGGVGPVGTLVLADAEALADVAGHVLAQLSGRTIGLAVAGSTEPARLGFVFGTVYSEHARVDVRVRLTAERVYVSHADARQEATWAEAPATLAVFAKAARPVLDGASVLTVEVDRSATVQQLADVLAALAAADVTTVDLAVSHGTSVSYGTGRLPRRPPPPRPAIDVRVDRAAGSTTRALVRRQILRAASRIQYCYELRLGAVPTLAGTIAGSLTIPATGGAPTEVTAAGVDPTVDACVVKTLRGLGFIAPHPSRPVTAKVTIELRPR